MHRIKFFITLICHPPSMAKLVLLLLRLIYQIFKLKYTTVGGIVTLNMSLRSTPSQKSVVSPLEIQKIPSFDASTCPILNVVVYPDKAEVCAILNSLHQKQCPFVTLG